MREPSQEKSNGVIRRFPLIAIAIVALIGLFLFQDQLSFAALAEHREQLLAWRDSNYTVAVVVFILAYAVMVAFSLPGASVATLTGGFLFAIFPGALYNVVGATAGAVAIFLAARWGMGEQLAAKLDRSEGWIKRFKQGIDRSQWEMLFLMRLVPIVPFFVANLVPALVGVPLSRYAISTFFGIIPGAIVYTSVGAGLSEVFAAGQAPNLGIIFEPHVLLPILGLAALAALPLFLKKFRTGEV